MVETELQKQQYQFSKQLAKVISEMQIQAVQDYLSSTEHKEELKCIGYNVYRTQVKEAGPLKIVKRHMCLSLASTIREAQGKEEDQVSSQAVAYEAEPSRTRETITGGNMGSEQEGQAIGSRRLAQDPTRANPDKN